MEVVIFVIFTMGFLVGYQAPKEPIKCECREKE